MAKEKPPIFGMLQRGGAAVIRMLENLKQVTIGPLIKRTITPDDQLRLVERYTAQLKEAR